MDAEKAAALFKELDLVGISDIARLLGWPMSKVTSYRSRNTGIGARFPEPLGEVGGRPVWTRSQFTEFKNTLQEEK
jgi:hypothetical protein